MYSDHPRTHFSGVFSGAASAIQCAALVLFAVPALAQPAAGINPPSAELTPAERAQRDGDKVFKWILIHSDKPRKSGGANKEEKTVSATRAKAAPRVAKAEDATERAVAAATPAAATPAIARAPAPAAVEAPAREPVSMPQGVAVPEGAPSNTAADAAATQEAAARPKESSDQAIATAPLQDLLAAPLLPLEEPPDEILKPIFQVDPKLPRNLMEMNRGDHVEVRFTVLPDGSVAEPTMVSASNRRLVPYALAAIAQWKFAPLRKPQLGSVDLVFNLQ
jgi:hypothetical protein